MPNDRNAKCRRFATAGEHRKENPQQRRKMNRLAIGFIGHRVWACWRGHAGSLLLRAVGMNPGPIIGGAASIARLFRLRTIVVFSDHNDDTFILWVVRVDSN